MLKALEKSWLLSKLKIFICQKILILNVAIGAINSYIDKVEEESLAELQYMHSLLPVCQNRKFKIEQEPKNKQMLEVSR